MRTTLCILALAIALTGCAATQYNYTAQIEEISNPPIGQTAKVSVGDAMLSQGKSKKMDVLIFDQDTPLPTNRLIIKQGYLVKAGEDQNFEYFVASDRQGSSKFFSNSMLGTPDAVESLALNKATKTISVVSRMPPPYPSMKLEEKSSIPIKPGMMSFSDPAYFQQTLIYNGKTGSKISIGYREFSGDIARPAFSNEAQYDLSESNTIGYKGARIEVVNASNQEIEYRVIQNFNKVVQ